jgi:hypothetical protein
LKLDGRLLYNFTASQAGWFACVLGAAHGLPLAGTAAAAAIVALHLAASRRPMLEFRLVALAALIGGAWESAIVSLGLMGYPSGTFAAGFAPHWIIAMWALFATTLNGSMAWMRGRPLAAMLVGAVGGPMAYLAGDRLGGVELTQGWVALGVQGLGWSVIMPLLTAAATRYDGFRAVPAPSYAAHGRLERADV